MKIHSLLLLSGALAFFAGNTQVAAQTTIAADEFNLNGTTRQNNFQLSSGAAVETGTGTWDSMANIRLNDYNGERMIYLNSSTTNVRAVLPFSYTDGDILTLTWGVSRDSSTWLAGGFHNGTSGSAITSNGQVWMNFNGGGVIARINGTATTIGVYSGGSDFSFSGGDYEMMSLSYNSSANTVSGSVNGDAIFTDYDLGGFTPTISGLILEFNNSLNTTGVVSFGDSFSSVQLTSIPEPGLFSLGAGFLALLYVASRRSYS